jgi:hypothetical protein
VGPAAGWGRGCWARMLSLSGQHWRVVRLTPPPPAPRRARPARPAPRLIATLRQYPATEDFVYLRPAPAPRGAGGAAGSNPYALRVVPFAALRAEPGAAADYYTLSVRGLTRVVDGASAEFTSGCPRLGRTRGLGAWATAPRRAVLGRVHAGAWPPPPAVPSPSRAFRSPARPHPARPNPQRWTSGSVRWCCSSRCSSSASSACAAPPRRSRPGAAPSPAPRRRALAPRSRARPACSR